MSGLLYLSHQLDCKSMSDIIFKTYFHWAVVVHDLNPSTHRQKLADPCDFETSLAYTGSQRPARAAQ